MVYFIWLDITKVLCGIRYRDLRYNVAYGIQLDISKVLCGVLYMGQYN